MLPTYKAIAVNQEAIISGSTKPCIMTVVDQDDNIVGDYVVKVFKSRNIEQSQPTNKEVYGSILAQAFDFAVPEPALIRVEKGLIDLLNESERYRNFKLLPGVYFGSAYLSNVLDYSGAVNLKFEPWEEETIFAFDAFIRNIDRRIRKPNLFFKDGTVHLVDHELSFELNGKTFEELYQEREKYWKFMNLSDSELKREHIFLRKLSAQNKKNPITFDTFREYLRTLNVDLLDEFASQLESLGNDSSDWLEIKPYLESVKQHPDKFIQILQELIA